jgi:hypothetical protein
VASGGQIKIPLLGSRIRGPGSLRHAAAGALVRWTLPLHLSTVAQLNATIGVDELHNGFLKRRTQKWVRFAEMAAFGLFLFALSKYR